MDEIKRMDLKLWIQELANPSRIFALIACIAVSISITRGNAYLTYGGIGLILAIGAYHAWRESYEHRFRDARMRALWKGVQDRLTRFEEAIKRLKRSQVADLNEMPETIGRVGTGLYVALRKADLIAAEILASEKDLRHMAPPIRNQNDPQSNELYQIADRNLAEYRQQYQAVMAGVQRTEAQAAVFMTTVDTLRMKILGYRLVGKSPEMGNQDFLSALAEARAQLQSIDTALEELDLSHYPKLISVVNRAEAQQESQPPANLQP